MANPQHVAKLKEGIDQWNAWTRTNIRTDTKGNLSGADLSGMDLRLADLRAADLGGANLADADLTSANLRGANLTRANLSRAILLDANLILAVLTAANLKEADLTLANLSFAVGFEGARVHGAHVQGTIFACTNLKGVQGLDCCDHAGRSVIDDQTLVMSGPLPLSFLRGCGLPDEYIDYLPCLLNQAIQFYSCFISYSTDDQDFADRLYADLQNKNVRCWFAPHDMQGGKKLHEQIDEAIRLYDRLLLILSGASMKSRWVKTEIANARQKELTQGTSAFSNHPGPVRGH